MTFCLKCDLSDIGENFNILSYSNLHYLTVVKIVGQPHRQIYQSLEIFIFLNFQILPIPGKVGCMLSLREI